MENEFEKEVTEQEVMSAIVKEPQQKHGRRIYWLLRHTKEGIKDALRRHIFLCVFILIAVVLSVFMFRAVMQPHLLFLRTKIFVLLFGMPFAYALWRMIFFGKIWRRLLATAFAASILFSVWQWGDAVHEYLSLYFRYKSLPQAELNEKPLTDNDRIQPLYSVHSIAYEAIGESNVTPMTPNFVRHGAAFDWTIGVEPKYFWPRLMGGVQKVLRAPGTTANVSFLDKKNQVEVSFATGEHSYWGHNVFTATRKTFGLRRYWNYQTDRVTYHVDDNGNLVQVVSLVRWKGFLFPRREFGGVQVIRQTKKDMPFSEWIVSNLSLFLFGIGEWVSPEEIKQYPFLQGQNNVPFGVTRYMADSFRFRAGIRGPLPWIHEGDVRIPDMKYDVNPQPFTTFFRVPNVPGKLYHYFSLEPYGPENQATILSLLIPSDDASVVYVYDHKKHNDLITGVSTIPAKVMGSQKIYAWDKNLPVEQRPYVKDIGGMRVFYWLSTVVTKKEMEGGGKEQFIAGAYPEIALTDGKSNEPPVWVDPTKPETWIDELKKKRETNIAEKLAEE